MQRLIAQNYTTLTTNNYNNKINNNNQGKKFYFEMGQTHGIVWLGRERKKKKYMNRFLA